MPWVRFDDKFPRHRKLRRLSDAAFRLHVSAIHWCSEHLTDGRIPDDELELVSDVKSPRRVVGELEKELWERTADSWLIHDYLDYQPSASKVRSEREAKKERQDRWKSRRNGSSPDASPVGSEDASGEHAPYPYPSRTRPVVKDLAGGVPVGSHPTPPSSRCPEHEEQPAVGPCGPCKDARLARQAWDSGQVDGERERRSEVRACRLCDVDGYRFEDDRRIPITPYVKCDHRPLRSVS